MEIYRAYKFRLYPNEGQKILIHKTFGGSSESFRKMVKYERG